MTGPTLDTDTPDTADAPRPLSARAEKMLRRYQRLRAARRAGRRAVHWGFIAALLGALGLLVWQQGPDAWDWAQQLRREAAPRHSAEVEDSVSAPAPVVAADTSTDTTAAPRRAASLLGRYEETMDSIREAMRSQLAEVGFTGAISAARLTRPRGVVAARRAVETARNVFRQYRRDTRVAEQAYLDSLTGRRHAGPGDPALREWEERTARSEPYAAAAATDSMLAAADSILQFLAARAGGYHVADGTLSFNEPQDGEHFARFLARLRQLAALGGGAATVAEAARVAE
jgi:hypothetical protein